MHKDTRYIMDHVKTMGIHVAIQMTLALALAVWCIAGGAFAITMVGLSLTLGYALWNGIYYYKHILKPYKGIEKHLYSYNQGYNSKVFDLSEGNYSFELDRAMDKIKKTLDSHGAIQRSSKRAEYRVLQNQINPHFLYNTLESIRSDAICEGAHNIAEITEALATFFRYTVSKSEHLVTLEAELSNAENYFAIQKYRFGDRIHMDIQCSEEVYNLLIPKLTLQPIIENAIIHGLEPKVDQGNLRIQVTRTEDRLMIQIRDDGVGMKEETLRKINRNLHQISSEEADVNKLNRGGIALINVNNRMKLMFGEMYGIRVTSVKGFGTTVDITVPITIGEQP